jgi:hypothetical protein
VVEVALFVGVLFLSYRLLHRALRALLLRLLQLARPVRVSVRKPRAALVGDFFLGSVTKERTSS